MEFINNFTVSRDNRSNSDEIEKMSYNSDDSNTGANTTISELESVPGAYVPGKSNLRKIIFPLIYNISDLC